MFQYRPSPLQPPYIAQTGSFYCFASKNYIPIALDSICILHHHYSEPFQSLLEELCHFLILNSHWPPSLCTSHPIGSDKNHTGIGNHCVSSSFCSHPAGPYPWEQERTMAPYQARPLLHLTFAQ